MQAIIGVKTISCIADHKQKVDIFQLVLIRINEKWRVILCVSVSATRHILASLCN